MLDQLRLTSTMAMHLVNSLQDGHDKWVTGAINTIKLPTVNNQRNMGYLHTLCLQQNSRTNTPRCYCWAVIGSFEVRWTDIGETLRGWTQDLVLWNGDGKALQGGIHCKERDCRKLPSAALPPPAESSPSMNRSNLITWPSSRFMPQLQIIMKRNSKSSRKTLSFKIGD